jgi:hypothetical protein
MSQSATQAPSASVPEHSVTADSAVRWLLAGILVAVLVSWWHLSHRLTIVEGNLSSSVSSVSGGSSFPSTDPVQCWMFGVGVCRETTQRWTPSPRATP